MKKIIKIGRINERIEFAISLLEFFFLHNEKIKIHIKGKLYDQDKKAIHKLNKSPFILRVLFNHYTFVFTGEAFDNIKSILYKYFAYDWGYIINRNHSASFQNSKNNFVIYCSHEQQEKVETILNEFAYKKIIDSYEELPT